MGSSVNKLFNHDSSIDASIESIETHLQNVDTSIGSLVDSSNNLESRIVSILQQEYAAKSGPLFNILNTMIEDALRG